MSNRFKKVIIDDVVEANLTRADRSGILDNIEYAIKSVAVTLARKAYFNTSDFRGSEDAGDAGWEIELKRLPKVNGCAFWEATASKTGKIIKVMAHLE